MFLFPEKVGGSLRHRPDSGPPLDKGVAKRDPLGEVRKAGQVLCLEKIVFTFFRPISMILPKSFIRYNFFSYLCGDITYMEQRQEI